MAEHQAQMEREKILAELHLQRELELAKYQTHRTLRDCAKIGLEREEALKRAENEGGKWHKVTEEMHQMRNMMEELSRTRRNENSFNVSHINPRPDPQQSNGGGEFENYISIQKNNVATGGKRCRLLTGSSDQQMNVTRAAPKARPSERPLQGRRYM